jgi:transposase-like protein
MKSWDEVTRDDLLRLYVREGLTQEQIGARFGVHRERVRRRMRCLGVPTAPHGKVRWYALTRDELQGLYRQLGSARAVARRFDVCQKVVLRRLRQEQIPVGPRGNQARFPLCAPELSRLYWQEGLSTDGIARRIGRCPRQVAQWMTDYGIPKRTPSERKTLPGWWKRFPGEAA